MTVTADLLSFLKSHGATAVDSPGADYVLSVYLDNSESNPARRHAWREQLRQFVRVEHTRMADAPTMLAHFEKCLTTLEARLPYLHAEVKPENAVVPGWMLLSAATGEALEARLSIPPEPMLRWEPCPILLPYFVATQAEEAVVVLIDHDRATISRLQRGIVHEVDVVRAETAAEDESHERLLSNARRKLSVIAGNDAPIVVGGARVSVAQFVSSLPHELGTRCAVADELHVHTPSALIPPIAHAALVDLLARRQIESLAVLDKRAHLTRHAAFGFDPVLQAAAASALERVLVTESLWVDRTLEVEQLCQRAIRCGACIEVATGEAAAALDLRGGIAAELRFAIVLH